jgi:hypothetical protein
MDSALPHSPAARIEVAAQRGADSAYTVVIGRRARRSWREQARCVSESRGGIMSELLLDPAGRRRSPATLPEFHAGRPPRNKGMRYPATRAPRHRAARRTPAPRRSASAHTRGCDVPLVRVDRCPHQLPARGLVRGLDLHQALPVCTATQQLRAHRPGSAARTDAGACTCPAVATGQSGGARQRSVRRMDQDRERRSRSARCRSFATAGVVASRKPIPSAGRSATIGLWPRATWLRIRRSASTYSDTNCVEQRQCLGRHHRPG